jgi:hypothetical protein
MSDGLKTAIVSVLLYIHNNVISYCRDAVCPQSCLLVCTNYIRTPCKVRLYSTKLALWHKGI